MKNNDKPKFLLHVCCGPCSVAIFEELAEQFDVTAHFYNPNIHPIKEYNKRKAEVIKICGELGISVIEEEYDIKKWFEKIAGLEEESEGGKRCFMCFEMRLEHAAKFASENGFQYFGTSLTSGRNKRANIINPIGKNIGDKFGIKFFEEDWKKGGRQEMAQQLIKQKNIYKQDYCGCVYSRSIYHVS